MLTFSTAYTQTVSSKTWHWSTAQRWTEKREARDRQSQLFNAKRYAELEILSLDELTTEMDMLSYQERSLGVVSSWGIVENWLWLNKSGPYVPKDAYGRSK